MLERAVLLDFDATPYTATIRYSTSLAGTIADVPVSRGIDSAELTAGRRVAVAVFDQANPADAMVVGVH